MRTPTRFGLERRVGPFSLTIAASTEYPTHVERLFFEFESSPIEGRGKALRLFLAAASLNSSPWPHSGPPRFRADAPTILVDESDAWVARLTFHDGGLDAHFVLRDEIPSTGTPLEVVRRELVMSALKATLAFAAPAVGGLLLHASALVRPDGLALAFAGPSGEGKTTMTKRLSWPSLADDAVLVYPSHAPDAPDHWLVTGTPLRGREGLPRSGTPHRLSALCHLAKASALSLAPMPRAASFAALMKRIIYFGSPNARLLDIAAHLVSSVPNFALSSSLSDDLHMPLSPPFPAGAT
jgi:hypothetical protein